GLGIEPLAEIGAYGMSADRYASLHTVPALAREKALKKAGRSTADLGLVEINEAFAGVASHAARLLELDEAIVNVNGGAVALGHPIGASGARIVLTLALEMCRRGGAPGGAALCGGGGPGGAPGPRPAWFRAAGAPPRPRGGGGGGGRAGGGGP